METQSKAAANFKSTTAGCKATVKVRVICKVRSEVSVEKGGVVWVSRT